MAASDKITQEMHNDYSDIFFRTGYFKCTFSLQVKGVKPYQDPLQCMAYALQELFKKELEHLQ